MFWRLCSRDNKTKDNLCSKCFVAVDGFIEVFQLDQADKSDSMGEAIHCQTTSQGGESSLGVKSRSEAQLIPAEMERARKLWVKQAQAERFSKKMQDLGGGKDVSRQSHLKLLTPILDELGLLRVGGRLTRAEFPYDVAHPVILPKKHHITQLIVADVHNRCRHAGVNHVLAQVQHRYWIIDG